VGRLTPLAAVDRGLEATLRRDRGVVGASLALVVALAWLYLWRDAASMGDAGMAGMPMADMPGMAPAPGPASLALTFVMWAVMMVGMMLPSAAPTILLYATLVRRNGERGTVLPGAWVFTSGYLAAWTSFSLLAALLQVALHGASLVTPALVFASTVMSAAALIGAGVYQWLPAKEVCLRKCRDPLQFLLAQWRPGAAGAFRMGVRSGAYCVGCCWALMLLLFVAGVMNLGWVALIAGFVLAEKLLPGVRVVPRLAGAAMILWGAALLITG
jgi:predicted metal-binding membrane protein